MEKNNLVHLEGQHDHRVRSAHSEGLSHPKQLRMGSQPKVPGEERTGVSGRTHACVLVSR